MTKNKFYEELATRGLILTQNQKDQFYRFYELLIEWNEKMNLTGITEIEEVYAKHFFDSLDPFIGVIHDHTLRICDVGTGAGFPGMPLAIAYPNVQFSLIDSLNKRIEFLKFCTKELELKNVTALHTRAEEFSLTNRESFDIVTSRAVARLNMLCELCAPLVKIGGQFITLKGPAGHEELKEAKQGPFKLGLKLKDISEETINDVGSRINITFDKVSPTPKKYPRQFGQIKKNPLV